MSIDERFTDLLADIGPDVKEQYLRQHYRSEILESRLPESQVASTVEQRNSDLFFEIADVLDFYPDLYAQHTLGAFDTSDGVRDECSDLGPVFDISLLEARGCSTVTCVAGWATALSGWHPTIHTHSHNEGTFLTWEIVAPAPLTPSNHHSTEDAEEVACALLGITDTEAEELFSGSPTGCSDYGKWTADNLRAIGKGRSVFADEWPEDEHLGSLSSPQ
ncbi:MAG: hypothetical protein P8M16_10370 [Acidimicrobiales bacterium]|nr:hypothetical protein [Acidimicrobiales bacterium]